MLDQDPLLVYGEKTERTRLHEGIEGELILKEAPLDPIADLVVRRMVDLNWTERASTQVGRIIGPVPRADLEPFIHQRYDDLSVLGGEAMSDALHDHLGRRPRRAARRGLPALPRRRPTTRSSTSTWPSARPTATSSCR